MIGITMACALAITAVASESEAPKPNDTQIEVLLNNISAKKWNLSGLRATLTVTPDSVLVIQDANHLYRKGWGAPERIKEMGGLDGYEYTDDGLFLAVKGKSLLLLDKDGKFKKLFALPSDGMGISAGRDKMFLFERQGTDRFGLYVLMPKRKYVKLLESPEPISGVEEIDDGRIVFAAGIGLFEIDKDGKAKLLAMLPKGKTIVSMAVKPDGKTIYLSDGKMVLGVKGEQVTKITERHGGTLRWFGDGLIVFDHKAPLLTRFRGIP